MANELTITTELSFSKNSVSLKLANTVQTITVSGDHMVHRTQEIGTSEEALDIGEITTPGWAYFRNMDDTNFVTIGETTNNDIIKLKAGESCIVRLGVSAPYAIADTLACDLEYIIIED